MSQSEMGPAEGVPYLYRPDARQLIEARRWNLTVICGLMGAVCLVFAPLHLVFIIRTVLGVRSPEPAVFLNSVGVVLALVYGLGFLTVFVMNVLLSMADITVSDEGIVLHLIGKWHQFIAWKQIRGNSFIDVPYTMDWKRRVPTGPDARPLNYRIAGLFDSRWNRRQLRTAFALRVDGLPIYFRLVGLFYRMGLTGLVIVTPDHDRHEELCDAIVADLAAHN